jgi:predicted component of type VI protein secretion system
MGREASPLERARDPRDLGVRLLDGATEGGRAAGWLASAFKNVMVQQVALLGGAMEGVRTLLAQLAPERIEEDLRAAGGRIGIFKGRALWQAYVEKHRRLSEEDRETFEAIFGPQLSKAYVELAGEGYDTERVKSK